MSSANSEIALYRTSAPSLFTTQQVTQYIRSRLRETNKHTWYRGYHQDKIVLRLLKNKMVSFWLFLHKSDYWENILLSFTISMSIGLIKETRGQWFKWAHQQFAIINFYFCRKLFFLTVHLLGLYELITICKGIR